MILEEILRDLRKVEAGDRLMHRTLAGKAADAIELTVEINRYFGEEKKKLETELRNKEMQLVDLEAYVRSMENAAGKKAGQ